MMTRKGNAQPQTWFWACLQPWVALHLFVNWLCMAVLMQQIIDTIYTRPWACHGQFLPRRRDDGPAMCARSHGRLGFKKR